MAQLTVQKIALTGVSPVYNVASITGDSFINNGRTYVHVKNGGASAVTVTLDSKQLSNYGTDVDIIISIPAGAERVIGFLDPLRFSNDLGIANIAYSAVTSVTVSIISQ
jgi:hypothetical protein